MRSIIVCTTGGDSLAKIQLKDYQYKRIDYELCEKPVGPHGIKACGSNIITSNTYNDSVSIFEGEEIKEIKNIKVGPKPNDSVMYDGKLFTICEESNSLVVYDMNEDKVVCEVTTGNWPHSIDICIEKNILVISNLEESTISIISLENYDVIKKIPIKEYPTKIRVSKNKEVIYICASYLGNDVRGYVEAISLNNFESIGRIKVGSSPIDIFEDLSKIYVANFTGGSISVINKDSLVVDENIYVGGMPKGIAKYKDDIYIGDYFRNKLLVVKNRSIIKAIAIDAEPNAMTLY